MVGGELRDPQLIVRSRIGLLPDGAWAPTTQPKGSIARTFVKACGCAVLVGTSERRNWKGDHFLGKDPANTKAKHRPSIRPRI